MACASCNDVYDRLASRSASGVLYDPWVSEYRDIVRVCGCEMVASCGHVDRLGYFAGTVCGACARRGHASALGGAR